MRKAGFAAAVFGLTFVVMPLSADIVADGGFEKGTPNPDWEEFSENFPSPICNVQRCGKFFGEPHGGDWWAWFGGSLVEDTSYLRQEVTIPAGTATLSFWLDITAQSGNGVDGFKVSVDEETVFAVRESEMDKYHPWTRIDLNIDKFADGGKHLLSFDSHVLGRARTNFFVDDVSITVGEGSDKGDLNCDGSVDLLDVGPFITALLDPGEYEKQYPDCDINNADINEDGSIDLTDVEPFIELLLGP